MNTLLFALAASSLVCLTVIVFDLVEFFIRLELRMQAQKASEVTSEFFEELAAERGRIETLRAELDGERVRQRQEHRRFMRSLERTIKALDGWAAANLPNASAQELEVPRLHR